MTAGRIEAQITVPTSTSVSVSNSGGGATTSTIPADDYFWHAAGTLDGLAATFASQLNTDQAPSSGSWTVTIDTGTTGTGRMAIGCTGTTAVPSFSLVWASTELRDACGFTRDIDYPQTAAQLTADLGYGVWTGGVGYLCNEASGNLSPAFGTGTLTAANSPSYSNQGPRGGGDKAVGFSGNTSKFTAASSSVLDIGTTDDFLFVWVGKFSAAPTVFGGMFTKAEASFAHGWAISATDGTQFVFDLQGSGSRIVSNLGANYLPGEWHVGIAARDCTAGTMRVGIRSLSTGTQYLGTSTTCPADSYSSTASFSVGDGSWVHANTEFQCAYVAAVKGLGVAAGVPANIATALSNFAATFGTWTGTKQVKFLWRPECPPIADQPTAMAPLVTDLRTTRGPTGVVYGLTGNSCYEHTNLTWSYVPKENVREAIATYANASWETFYADTQIGQGHTWGGVSLPVQIYDNAGTLLGSDLNSGAGADGWYITGVDKIKPERSVQDWDARWKIVIPSLVSSG